MRTPESEKPSFTRLRWDFWILIAVWTILISLSLTWNLIHQTRETLNFMRLEAQSAFDKDILFRSWNAMHGGVYVPVTEDTPPNPFLADIPERDITTPSGRMLTLMNPAYMTRQVHTLASMKTGVLGHITSLNPLRPENGPDAWETEALKAFQRGDREISSIEPINGAEYLRFMRPFTTDKSCLKCHAAQGYKEGDIRGGISISVPLAPYFAGMRRTDISLAITHFIIWMIGLIGLVFSSKTLKSSLRTLDANAQFNGMVLNSLFAHIAIMDETGRIIQVNKAWSQFARENNAETDFIGWNYLDVCDKAASDDAPGAEEAAKGIRDVIRGEIDKFEMEYPCHSPEQRRWFIMRAARVTGTGSLKIVIAHLNITERKIAEESLQAERDRLKLILDNINVGIYIGDTDYNLIYVNPALIREFGPFEDRKCFEYFHDKHDVCPWCHNNEIVSGKSYNWECKNLKNGRIYDILDLPLRNADDSFLKLVVMQDISDRKRFEEQILRQNDELEALNQELLANADELSAQADSMERQAGELETLNQQLLGNEKKLIERERQQTVLNWIAEIFLTVPDDGMYSAILNLILEIMDSELGYFGYINEQGSLVSVSLTQNVLEKSIIPDKDTVFPRESWAGIWGRSLLEKRSIYSKGPFNIPAGHVPLKNVLAVPLIHLDAVIGQIVIANRAKEEYNDQDVALMESIADYIAPILQTKLQRDRIEKARMQLVKELADANKELNDFAFIVSHDLKAPLRAIGSLAGWVSSDYSEKLDEQGKEQLKMITSKVKKMNDLIDGVLRYSRVGRIREEMAPVDLNETLAEVIEICHPPENIKIIKKTTLPTVTVEPTRIGQVFQNLTTNAIKFMDKPRGLIEVDCARENGFWKFSVSDNGPGIPPQDIDRVFQIFQTAASTGGVESTGIGLSIAKKIVEMYGGKIWVESKVGEGTVFYFTLPVAS